MIVALTGATGYVGRFLVQRLLAGGASVRAWRRPASDRTALPRAIEWVEGELGSGEAAAALVRGADSLVHAALAHEPGRYRGGEGNDPARFWRQNVDGSVALLEAARVAGVGRAVVFSSRAVFGAAARGPIGDADEVSPDTHYGAAKAELETYIRKFAGTWPVAALRPTGVYGVVDPVARSKWFALVGDALAGREIEARAGSEVHGDDVAAACVALLEAPAADIAGRAFNCSDIVVSHRDIVTLVQAAAGVTGPVPEEGSMRGALMRCDRLKALGMVFGGRRLFEASIQELVAQVRAAQA